jgi:hypothetical protein
VQLPFALALSTEISDFRYDAIAVDEGQDLRDEFWSVDVSILTRCAAAPDPGMRHNTKNNRTG